MEKMITTPLMQSDYIKKPIIDLDQHLRSSASTHPQQLALADSLTRLTWRQLDRRLNQIANCLLAQGIQPNSRSFF